MVPIKQLTNEQVVARARKAYESGRTKPLEFRKQQLGNLHRMLDECRDEITDALYKDLRKSKLEATIYEIDTCQSGISILLRGLKKYAAREYLPLNLGVFLTDRGYIEREPFGVVTVLGPWNYPVALSLLPMISALAAGNVVIIKPSECTPHSAEILFKKLGKYLDQECYQVVLGDVERTTDLLTHKMDYIYFTGSSATGRSVYLSAAQHLTPCTLELGGKSPCYIDDTADVYLASKRILWGKFINLGQTCIAPDYILCSKASEQKFLQTAKEVLVEFFGEKWQEHPDTPRIVNNRNFLRIKKMLESTNGRIVYGGKSDEADLWIEPTIVVDVAIMDSLMQEEVFGPIIPILSVKNVDEAISIIQSSSAKPLALYTFAKDVQVNEKLIKNCTSGGVCVNDVCYQSAFQGLPFGGIGDSGLGSYGGGKLGFDTFSHKRAVLERGTSWFAEKVTRGRYPPYTEKKIRIFRWVNRYKENFNTSGDSLLALIGAYIVFQCTSGTLAGLAGASLVYVCTRDRVTPVLLGFFFLFQYFGRHLTWFILILITSLIFLLFE